MTASCLFVLPAAPGCGDDDGSSQGRETTADSLTTAAGECCGWEPFERVE